MIADNEAGFDPAAAEAVITDVLDDMATTDHKAVIVDSPAGAGKSSLVVRAAPGHTHLVLTPRRRTRTSWSAG